MYHSLYQFAKAYQFELIRSVTLSLNPHSKSTPLPSLWRRSLSSLGDIFITIGMRLKCHSRYGVDLSRCRT
jgi:hypothetical protein